MDAPNFKILIVEDEKDINNLLALQLGRDSYCIDQAFDGFEASQKIQKNNYDVILLDWMLPSMSGLEILKKITELKNIADKKLNRVSVIMTTAKARAEEVIEGLESGADDYILKPFDINILRARIKAVLRRTNILKDQSNNIIKISDMVLNLNAHQVDCNGKKIDLTISEFKLLATLVINYGRVMTRKELVNEVQGDGISVIERSIDTHMVSLRKKLGGSSGLIKTIRGVGYKLQMDGEK